MEFDKLANKKGLKLVHLNIYSLIGKIDHYFSILGRKKGKSFNCSSYEEKYVLDLLWRDCFKNWKKHFGRRPVFVAIQ